MRKRQRGIALMVVLQLLMVVLVISIAFLVNSNNNLIFLGQERRGLEAFYAAESGLQVGLRELFQRSRVINADPTDPYGLVDAMAGTTLTGDVEGGDGRKAGAYTVTSQVSGGVTVVSSSDKLRDFDEYKTVTLTSTGLAGGMRRVLQTTVWVGLQPIQRVDGNPFNYAYFMNNWGWFSGFGENQMVVLGNNGANANFDLIDGYLAVFGNPFFKGDGTSTSQAAIYAAQEVRQGENAWFTGSYNGKQSYAPFREMPNLSNMDYYKDVARGKNGSRGTVKKGSAVLIDGVFGEQGKQSIVLEGTSSEPIVIDGPVVVEGNVVLKGVVKGQGTLYVGRNLYVAGDVTYANAPTERPRYDPSKETLTEYVSDVMQWIDDNKSQDAVTYAVRKNVVYGDVSDKGSWWDGSVGPWITRKDEDTGEYTNDNHEDAGTDMIWTSRDATENDGKWTVQAVGGNGQSVTTMTFPVSDGKAQVPDGVKVIPGTGEDIDGDGQYTPPLDYYKDFAFADKSGTQIEFNGQFFANFPASGPASYSDYVTPANRIDGFIYTNNATAGDLGDWSGDTYMRGGVVGRQDAMTTRIGPGASHIMEHDERFGSESQELVVQLPPVPGIKVMAWREVTGE